MTFWLLCGGSSDLYQSRMGGRGVFPAGRSTATSLPMTLKTTAVSLPTGATAPRIPRPHCNLHTLSHFSHSQHSQHRSYSTWSSSPQL